MSDYTLGNDLKIANHWPIRWQCGHEIQSIKDGLHLPTPECPYCRIALLEAEVTFLKGVKVELEAVAEAAVEAVPNDPDDRTTEDAMLLDALRAAGYFGEGE